MNLQLIQNKNTTTQPPNKKSRCATREEIIERLANDMDSLVVGVLDDLSYEIIKAYGGKLPKELLEWIGTTATNNIRRLAKVIYSGDAAKSMTPEELHITSRPDSVRLLAICWLRPQMENRYGPLPPSVHKLLSGTKAPHLGN